MRRREGLIVKDRPAAYRAGHRRAVRACVAWLHREAASMANPHARALLNEAAFHLGQDAAHRRRGCTCTTHGRWREECPMHGEFARTERQFRERSDG